MQTKQAIKYFGSKAKVAKALKISRAAVTRWGEVVPIKKAWKINRISGDKVKMRIGDYR